MPGILQPLASRVDIIHLIGDMAEVAATVIDFTSTPIFGRPVIGQLDLSHIRLTRRCQENQRKTGRWHIVTTDFLQPDQVEKPDRGVGIGDPDHGMKKLNQRR